MRLEIGDIVKTNYNTGPYAIAEIIRGCTCPKYLDEINFDDPPPSAPHIHLVVFPVVRGIVDRHKSRHCYLSGYNEKTLKSVWDNDDKLILCKQIQPVQMTFSA